MRKSFLLLFLMALLPLAGWAETIALQPYVLTKVYGTADAAVTITAADFKVEENAATPLEKADIATALNEAGGIIRVNSTAGTAAGEAADNSYTYRYPAVINVSGTDYNVVTSQNGTLNIIKGTAAITGLALANWTYGEEAKIPEVTSAKAGDFDVDYEFLYSNGNDPTAEGYAEGTYDKIVNGQAGDYYVLARVAETTNYKGATDYVGFTIAKKNITSPAFGAGSFAITFGEPAPDWGLTFTENDLVYASDADEFEVVKNDGTALPTAAAAAAYTVMVVDKSGNYNFTSATAEYTINFKAINAEGIAIQNASALPNKTYKAAAWELTTADTPGDPVIPAELQVFDGETRLVEGTDYTVAYASNTDAGTATITITGAGNYETVAENTLTANFTINPATLNVALTNPAQVISYGGDWVKNLTITGWQGTADETAFNTAVTADKTLMPTATIPAGDDYDDAEKLTPGEHTVIIAGGAAPDNYEFAFADDNTVTVGKATITISLKPDAETDDLEWKGTDTPTELANALATAYKLSVDLNPATVFSVQPTVISAAAAAADYVPASYAITFQAHDAVLAAAFADKYTLAWDDTPQNFTITKKALTITAKNQAVAKVADAAESEYNGDAEYGVTYTIDGFAKGESAEDLDNASLDLTALTLALGDDGVKTAGGTTTITPAGATSDYYYIAYVAGTLTVAGDGVDITLPFTDEAKALIDAADGNENVKVTFAGTREWLADEWYTVVLPFDVKPAELVAQLGTYVVVNRLSTSSTADHIAFKLEMQNIPAGEAFLMKVADDLDWDGKFFENRTISKNLYDFAAIAAGNKLVGVYETTEIQATSAQEVGWIGHSNQFKADGTTPRTNKWYVPASAPKAIEPLDAYLVYAESSIPATARLITVEDADGTITAISEVSAGRFQEIKTDGWYTVGGVKLQGAPTQKGIYINNGKKIVVK